jgi:hypothetical protein
MERALHEPDLWNRLVDGITPRRTLEECAAEHLAVYRCLLEPQREPVTATRNRARGKDKSEGMVSHVG